MLKAHLDELRKAIENKDGDSSFRITLLKDLTSKDLWVTESLDSVLMFINLLEQATERLAELVALKRKKISGQKILARDLALVAEAQAIREKPPKYVQASINKHETERQKVIKSWAKQFKITYATATTMLEATEKSIKKEK